jgi:hypothetical protein
VAAGRFITLVLQVRWDRGSERWFALVLVACALTCFQRRSDLAGAGRTRSWLAEADPQAGVASTQLFLVSPQRMQGLLAADQLP